MFLSRREDHSGLPLKVLPTARPSGLLPLSPESPREVWHSLHSASVSGTDTCQAPPSLPVVRAKGGIACLVPCACHRALSHPGPTQNWQLFGLLGKNVGKARQNLVSVASRIQRPTPRAVSCFLGGRKGILMWPAPPVPGNSAKAQHFCGFISHPLAYTRLTVCLKC